jgi:hypothetical protein
MDLFWCCDKASNKYAPADVQYSNVPQSHAAIEFSRSHSVDCPTRNGSRILIKTGGTALQAVPREAALEPDMISVSVPEGVIPGQEILVTHPDGTGRCMRATVPDGALPGHSFLVQFRSDAEPVMGVQVEQDLLLSAENNQNESVTPSNQENTVTVVGTRAIRQDLQQTQQTSTTSGDMLETTSQSSGRQESARKHSLEHQDCITPDGRVLITIPYGSKPGEKIRVRHEDGRIIETTIPKELPANVSQFYVKIPNPNHQNWHDNPVVYGAPLLAGPFFGI